MPKCPYCKKDLSIEDFLEIKRRETKKGKIKVSGYDFKGESFDWARTGFKMWICPACDSILGFSEYRYEWAT
jgi:hypothetical protein